MSFNELKIFSLFLLVTGKYCREVLISLRLIFFECILHLSLCNAILSKALRKLLLQPGFNIPLSFYLPCNANVIIKICWYFLKSYSGKFQGYKQIIKWGLADIGLYCLSNIYNLELATWQLIIWNWWLKSDVLFHSCHHLLIIDFSSTLPAHRIRRHLFTIAQHRWAEKVGSSELSNFYCYKN